MKRHTLSRLLMFVGLVTVGLLLVACVRPVPTNDTGEEVTPTVEVPTLPTATPIPPTSEPTVESGVTDGSTGDGTIDGSTEGPTDGATEGEGGVVEQPTEEPSGTEDSNQGGGIVENTGTHTVQPGETVYSLSQRYGVPAAEIAAANNLDAYYTIYVGQVLEIPQPGEVNAGGGTSDGSTGGNGCTASHVVRPGENLFRIGLQYGRTVEQIATSNGIANPNDIDAGVVLCIP